MQDSQPPLTNEELAALASAVYSVLASEHTRRIIEAQASRWAFARYEVDLSALAMNSFSLSDPIGQIVHTVEEIINTISTHIVDAVKNAVNYLYTNYIEPAINALKTVVNDLVNAVKNLPSAINDVIKSIENFAGELVNAVKDLGNKLYDYLKKLPSAVASAIKSALKFLQNLPNEIKNALASLGHMILDAFDKFVSWMEDNLPKWFNTLKNAFESLKKAVEDWASKIAGVIKTITDIINKYVVQPLKDLIGAIEKRLAPVISNIISFLEKTVAPVLQNLWNSFTQFIAKFDQFWMWVGDRLADIADQLGKLLSNIGKTVWEYIQKGASWIVARIRDFINAVAQGVHWLVTNLPKIISGAIQTLSSWFHNIMQAIGKGVEWLSQKVTDLVKTFASWGKQIWDFLTQLPGKIWQGLQWLWGELTKAVGGIVKAVEGALHSAYNALRSILSNIWNALTKIGGIIYKYIMGGINWLIQSFQQYFQLMHGFSEGVKKWFNNIWQGIQHTMNAVSKVPEQAAKLATQQLSPQIQQVGEQVNQVATIIKTSPVSSPQVFVQHVQTAVKPPIEHAKTAINNNVNYQHTITRQTVTEVGQKLSEQFLQLNNSLRKYIPPESVCTYTPEKLKSFFNETLYKPLGELYEQQIKNLEKFAKEVLPRITAERTSKSIKPELSNIYTNVKTLTSNVSHLSKLVSHQSGVLQEVGKWVKSASNAFAGFVNALSNINETLNSIFGKLPDLINDLIGLFENPGKVIGDFMQAIGASIDYLLKGIVQFFSGSLKVIEDAFSSGIKALENMVKTAASSILGAVKAVINAVISAAKTALQDAWHLFIDLLGFLGSSAMNLMSDIGKAIKMPDKLYSKYSSEAKAFMEVMTGGLATPAFSIFFNLPWNLVVPTMATTVVAYELLSRVLEVTFNSWQLSVKISPLGVGMEINLKDLLGKIGRALSKVVKDLAEKTYEGFALGIAFYMAKPFEYAWRSYFVNALDGVAVDLYRISVPANWIRNAYVNAFADPVSETKLRDFARRMMSLYLVRYNAYEVLRKLIQGQLPDSETEKVINTVRVHMALRGLPKWFIEYYTNPALAIGWTDRFGNRAWFLLGELFEIPTHSELARMTIKDIIPDINLMYSLGWLRGWPPDVTRSIYLMNFKYPSFEKLLKFYYRAISGMLWYSPPPAIRTLFQTEAKRLGAGIPISPYDIQRAIKGPTAVSGLETALGTYFKWLEYSNFSWFSEKTVVNGVPVGRIVHNTLGGWSADSWILADIAADIPGKIDQRWMSRYAIFQWMIERGFNPSEWIPLVDVIPKLLEEGPASPIQLDLRAHSKLLQATGLHPAWVPIVTVAENIMVISDEMTLMRTGWLNLFKYGLLTLDQVEQYLSGIITVAYNVLYFDQEAKEWKEAWVNLPVRWLPHERKLLQIRMTIDRVMNLFRELYSYLRTAVRNLALPIEGSISVVTEVDGETVSLKVPGMKDLLLDYVNKLDSYFRSEMKAITGTEMSIGIDPEYIGLWLDLERYARDIEVLVKARYLWYRLSGYLLYRLAYGYVKYDDVKKLIEDVSSILPITPEEKALYMIIFKDVLGIMVREYVPTPSQYATIAEYVPQLISDFEEQFLKNGTIPKDSLLYKVFDYRNVPQEWWPIWAQYIIARTRANDARRIATELIELYAYKLITDDQFKQIYEQWLRPYGWDDKEYQIMLQAAQLRRLYVWDWMRYYAGTPTPNELARLAELFGPVLSFHVKPTFPTLTQAMSFIDLAFEVRGVPEEWRPLWRAFIQVRNVYDEIRRVVTRVIAGYARGTIKTKDDFMQALDQLEEEAFSLLPPEVQEMIQRELGGKTGWLFTQEERELLFAAAQYERDYMELRNIIPTPMQLGTIAEVVPETIKKLDDLWKYQFYPEPYDEILKQYVMRRRFADEKRMLERSIARAHAWGVSDDEVQSLLLKLAQSWGFNTVQDLFTYIGLSQEELELAEVRAQIDVLYEEYREAHRAWAPTPLTLANILDYVKISEDKLNQILQSYRIPDQFKDIVYQYVRIRPYYREFNEAVRYYYNVTSTAYYYTASVTTALQPLQNQISNLFDMFNFDRTEQSIMNLYAQLRAVYERARRGYTSSIPTLAEFVRLLEYVPEALSKLDWLFQHYFTPEEWQEVWRKYAERRPVFDEVRRYVTALLSAYAYGAIDENTLQYALNSLKEFGYTDREIGYLLKVAQLRREYVEARLEGREYIPTPLTLAAVAEYVPSAANFIDQVLEFRHVPKEWWDLWKTYVQVRPIADDVRRLMTAYARALRYGADLGGLENVVLSWARKAGWTDTELELLRLRVELEELADEAREARREYIPTPLTLAAIAEYVPSAVNYLQQVLDYRHVPSDWRPLWEKYVQVRPVADEVRRLITTAITAYAYGVLSSDDLAQIFAFASQYGWTDREISILTQVAELRRKYVEARLEGREYIPTPAQLATIAEYVPRASKLIQQVLEARNVPKEWWPVWEQYVKVRPVADEVRRLITTAITAYAYGAITSSELEQIFSFARNFGWTDEEISILRQVAQLRAEYVEARTEGRSYIPTPYQLGTIAEYVPWARNLLQQVFEYRHVPPEWQPLWEAYVNIRPIYDEVRRIITTLINMYERFEIDDSTLQQILNILKNYGIGDLEALMIERIAKLRAQDYAWREIVGTPRSLVTMAEYSPTARSVALGQVYKMIDALPIDENTKALLKKMWEEYIRIRPVYDEVRRYVTELINDYAYGVIDLATLEQELNELKQWGLDDYEIQFYIWLAEKRRVRIMIEREYYG